MRISSSRPSSTIVGASNDDLLLSIICLSHADYVGLDVCRMWNSIAIATKDALVEAQSAYVCFSINHWIKYVHAYIAHIERQHNPLTMNVGSDDALSSARFSRDAYVPAVADSYDNDIRGHMAVIVGSMLGIVLGAILARGSLTIERPNSRLLLIVLHLSVYVGAIGGTVLMGAALSMYTHYDPTLPLYGVNPGHMP